MSTLKEVAFCACSTFIVIEIIYYITPKDGAVKFAYGIIYTLVIFSAITTISKVDFELYNLKTEFSEDYLYNMYLTSAEIELANKVSNSLEVIGVEVEEIVPKISIDDENVVKLDSINVKLKNFTDLERAKILLDSLFENSNLLEVTYSDD